MINTYLKDTVTINILTTDLNGVKTFTATTGIKARVELENKLLINPNGQEVRSNGYMIIQLSATIDYTSTVTINTVNGSAFERPNKKYQILKLSKAHGFGTSRSHWEVWF